MTRNRATTPFTPDKGNISPSSPRLHLRQRPASRASDIPRFFRLTPPTVHQMLLTLEKAGLISRQPGMPRSIAVLVERDRLPRLDPPDFNPSNSP